MLKKTKDIIVKLTLPTLLVVTTTALVLTTLLLNKAFDTLTRMNTIAFHYDYTVNKTNDEVQLMRWQYAVLEDKYYKLELQVKALTKE